MLIAMLILILGWELVTWDKEGGFQMKFKELREQSGMNKMQFSHYFEIPYRTIQNWELGTRKCPSYILKLMLYKLNNEKKKEQE